MEFKINKVDMEVRERIRASTLEGKVHKNGKASFSKKILNKNDEQKENYSNKKENESFKKILQSKVGVDEGIDIDAFKDNAFELGQEKGNFLDVRK